IFTGHSSSPDKSSVVHERPITPISCLRWKPTGRIFKTAGLRTDWDILFQPMFDELLTPPPSVDLPAPEVNALFNEVVAPVLTVSTDSPSSTTVDQDAPSPSNFQTTTETQPPVIPNNVEEDNYNNPKFSLM
ncbi:hypothetical protein Tco_1559673, partial [Tanacetum coccineum]